MPMIDIKDALNKAFVKVRPERASIDKFKANFITMFEGIKNNPSQTEESLKGLVSDFLKNTWYAPDYFINPDKWIDLVIYDGDNKSPIAVMIETKKPSNKNEMVTLQNLNAKAMQELLLYYFRETIDNNNLHLKNLIITNTVEWFIFDVKEFYDNFSKNSELVNLYNDFKSNSLFANDTSSFYKSIAAPFIEKVKNKIDFTYFNISEFQDIIYNNNKEDDNKLINLYKILSPNHLLKKSFVNDSNILNDNFYYELLYILGLSEEKIDSKKVIVRCPVDKQQKGSLLESAIYHIGEDVSEEDTLFNIAFELIITWINRILFLKLLEAQLLIYQNGNKEYSFLNTGFISNYGELNDLFFKVLAKRIENREATIRDKYKNIPYLNSSLFEKIDNESRFAISNLQNREMDIYQSSVLKDEKGNRKKGKIKSLDYLFSFLDAFDFSSEGSEQIQEQHKTLINASVLGLFFEKINGYKDGSYFTPGFVTSYICSETVKNVVINKFNKAKGWNVKNTNDIFNKINNSDDIAEANKIINSITILDPAVGSGHFLVSALNEIIAIKSEIGILVDSEGRRIKKIKVYNDELIVYDDYGEYFEYRQNNRETQRIQETLFQEKRQIIENSLFGVDININSVKICRLRLWIELLKHSFYTKESGYKQLETLPNLDINIKKGNSLINRFDLTANIQDSLSTLKYSIKDYKEASYNYKNSNDKEENQKLLDIISKIKTDFSENITKQNSLYAELKNLEKKLGSLGGENIELEFITDKQIQEKSKKIESVNNEIEKKKQELYDFLNGKIYEDAFEWRFEFPEVLDKDGNFLGFDAVIGNPPYIKIQNIDGKQADYLKSIYHSSTGKFDIYVLFIEKAFNLIKKNGLCLFIQPHRFINADYGKGIKNILLNNKGLNKFIHFGVDQVFGNVTTYTGIFFYNFNNDYVLYAKSNSCDLNSLTFKKKNYDSLNISWSFEASENNILNKIYNMPIKLLDIFEGIYQGVITVGDDIFIIEGKIKNNILEGFSKELNKNVRIESDLMKPLLKGEDIKRYRQPVPKYYIFYPHIIDKDKTVSIEENILKNKYPLAYKYISNFKDYLKVKKKEYKTNPKYWYSLHRARNKKKLETKKIITPQLQNIPSFAFDENNCYPDAGGYSLIPYQEHEGDIFAYFAILNSSLFYYFIKSTSTAFNNDYYYFKNKYIEPFKFPKINDIKIKLLIDNVKKIMLAKKKNPSSDTLKLEKAIDDIVYSLYELTPEEIEIVEKRR